MEFKRFGNGGWYYTAPQDEREHPRRITKARMMIKIGLEHMSSYGFCDVKNISQGGLLVLPDPITVDVLRECHPGKTIIMIGAQPWLRHFSLSGHVARVSIDREVGIRITSTTSDEFLREWIEKGEPR